MKIEKIDLYRVNIPLTVEYGMSGDRIWKDLDSTIVAITTQSGVVGWGESCPWGVNYLPGHAGGVLASIQELTPALIGRQANEMDKLNQIMDLSLSGHGYAKHAIDMACWDAFGKSVNLPLSVLLGGVYQEDLRCVAGVPNSEPEKAIETINDFRDTYGYTVFSCKITGDLSKDLRVVEAVMHNAKSHEHYIFDANKGLNLADALRCANFLSRYDVIFEQPTKTYEEFYALRKRSSVPLMMDEIFTGMETMWRIIKDNTCEMVNLKIAKVGGLSQARLIRDICVEHGMPLSIQCCGGSEITQAAIMHLAQSTRPPYMHCIWDCTQVNSIKVVSNAPDVTGGSLRPSGLPGLGVTPDMAVLGRPAATFS